MVYFFSWSNWLQENSTSIDTEHFCFILALCIYLFSEMGEKDFRSLIEEFPEFKESDISDLRLQFQTFDLNQDGIIDFREL